jgi:hypothetical protein
MKTLLKALSGYTEKLPPSREELRTGYDSVLLSALTPALTIKLPDFDSRAVLVMHEVEIDRYRHD